MKIRIKGNSLRYRLVQSDVEKLGKTGSVEEQTNFAGNTLVYALEKGKENKLTATFVDNRITVMLSQSMIDELYHTGRIGFDDKTGPVSLLVEKDFVCIDNTDEDQSDNYPNPNAQEC